MTYAENIKQKLNANGPDSIRAVIYARVSTDLEGQKESCANQVELAMNYISKHSNIKLIDTFVDDGISGKNDFNRPRYNDMLQQISNGNIDLIITKALSRLNRDELNSLVLKGLLLKNEATVLTLEDNQIHDFEDMNSELIHSINFAIDAQYVRRQSNSGRKTQELRIQRKELSRKDCSFGYDWNKDTKTITINPDQAEVVRNIYKEYVYLNEYPSSIKRKLDEDGINLCGRTISNILQDTRYIGKFYINKKTTKLGTGRTKSKTIKIPKEQWLLVDRPDLRIISNDLFDMAQRLRKAHQTVYNRPDKKTARSYFQGFHKYAGKIFCPVCGKPYIYGFYDRAKKEPLYRVKPHNKCSNPFNRIYEADLDEIITHTLKQTISQQNEVYAQLEDILTECVK